MSDDLRVDFWIGDVLSEEVDSVAFAGMPLELVMDDIRSVYYLPNEVVILVNDVPVSRRDYDLEIGDKVTLILGSRGIPIPEKLDSSLVDNPVLQFDFDGATWHLTFGAEKGQFTTEMNGFRLYQALLEKPDTDLMVLELEQKAGLGGAITEKGGQSRADAVADPMGLKKIREAVQRLQREIEDTVNEERIAELKQQQLDLLARRDKLVNKHGKSRTIGPATEVERARMRVHNNLVRARTLIARSMPKFAQYLENTIRWNSPCWSYRPTQNPTVP